MSTITEERPVREKADTQHLTTQEALQWISKAPRATRFYFHVQMDASADPAGETVFRDAIYGSLRLTGRDIMDFVRQGLSATMEDRGARWRCTVSRHKLLDKTVVSYWVG